MGREKRKNKPPAGASGSREKRRRTQRVAFDHQALAPEGLVAKPAVPKSRHHTYFEFVENTDKKEKVLEVQVERAKPAPICIFFRPRLTNNRRPRTKARPQVSSLSLSAIQG
jgi:hypothetical protein